MTTALQVAEKAIQLADQNPDFVYKPPTAGEQEYADCVYVHEGKGSCIFGQALMALGVADAEYLDRKKDLRVKPLIWDMRTDGMIEYDDDTLLSKMVSAQILQDNLSTWADAVAELREYVGKQAA